MYPAIKSAKSTKTSPQSGRFRRKAGQVARPSADQQNGSQNFSPVFPEPAFVKQCFLPLISSIPPELKDQQRVEQGFFNSLQHLCRAYGIESADFSDFPYSLNLRQHLLYLCQKLRALHPELNLQVVKGIIDVATISTVRSFDTGRTLYYIPVEPLHKLMLNPERKQTADLLTSVFCYLHQVVQVDHFAERGSYLAFVYSVLTDWAEEEDDDEHTNLREHFAEIESAGDYNLGLISDQMHLQAFEERLKKFQPVTPAEQELLKIANAFYALYLDFPTRSIYERILDLHDVDEEEYGVVRLRAYLSFYWSQNGIEYDQMIDFVDTDLQECARIDEPSIVHYFDRPVDLADENFDFEKRLFDLLNELCDNLKDLNHECFTKN